MTEIEVFIGEDAYNMHQFKIKTLKDISLVRQALNLKEKELKLEKEE